MEIKTIIMNRKVKIGDTIMDLITGKETVIEEIKDSLSYKYHCSNGYCYDRDGFKLKPLKK